MPDILKPITDGLSPLLVASFTAVDYDGKPIDGEPEVQAPLLDGGTHSMQFNWQSPFEQLGPESKAPAIAAMLQSGALAPLAKKIGDAAQKVAGDAAGSNSLTAPLVQGVAGAIGSGANKVNDGLREIRGRTGVTKINSTQAYSGQPPSKFSITLMLRAYKDASTEVMAPLQKLLEWAHPIALAQDGIIVGAVTGSNGQSGVFNNLLPSQAPRLIDFRYRGRLMRKMVIESIEEPITSPCDSNGNYTAIDLTMTLATLTALDRQDISSYFQRAAAGALAT